MTCQASASSAGGARQPAGPQCPRVAPLAAVGPVTGVDGERSQQVGAVLGARDLAEELVLGELARREFAEVLVDPVGHERSGYPLLPPRLCAHLTDPGLRRI